MSESVRYHRTTDERGTPVPRSDVSAHFNVSRDFLEFLDWLKDRNGNWQFADDVIDLLDKPHRYSVEFVQFLTERESER